MSKFILAIPGIYNVRSNIVSVEAVDDLIVENGTPFADVQMLLPSYLDFTLSDSAVITLQVLWAVGSYDAATADTYTLSASIVDLPPNITDTSSVAIQVDVIVLNRYAMWFSTEYLTSLFQETATNTVTNPVTADADPVGTMYDRGNDAFYARTATNVNRPILGSDANMNGYITGQGVNLVLPSSSNRFRFFYDTNSWFFHVCFKKETGADGVLKVLFRTLGTSPNSANVGVSCRLTAANQFQFLCYKGTAGTPLLSLTSTQTVTEAMGWTRATVVVNGTGAASATLTLTTQSGVDVTETFTTNAGSVTAGIATTDMQFGGDTAVSISAIMADARVPSAGEVTAFKTYNPTRKTDNFPLVKKWDLFDDPAYLFEDAGGTTPASDGGIVRLVVSKKAILSTTVFRNASATTDAKSPIYRASDADINNNSALEWDGSDDNLDLSNDLFPERARYVYIVVARNEDATNGSHLASGQRYFALTGSNYTAGTNPRLASHAIDASTIWALIAGHEADVYQIFVMQMVGANWKIWNSNKDSATGTNNTEFRISDIGDPFASIGELWRMDGRQHRVIQYNGTLTDAQAENIVDYFSIKLGI